MKFPYNPKYEKMKLPYSCSEFQSSLTGTIDYVPSKKPKNLLGRGDSIGGAIPHEFFEKGFKTEFGHSPNPIFMLWPSSWRYPDGCDPFLT